MNLRLPAKALAKWFAVDTLDRVKNSSETVLRPCRGPQEWPDLVRIWRSAVEATHHFLTLEDITYYENRIVNEYLAAVELTVATVEDVSVGFSGVAEGKLEMLFVDHAHRGRGAGSALLRRAMADIPDLLIDVNEQNPQALEFYRHHGFAILNRSETDADGRPFPILHLGRRS
ncbi:GNAT family N-acetyltransferase [Nocardia terpenica]|nr:GNAT family N-acetyltransferase [Nocardia terpenica]